MARKNGCAGIVRRKGQWQRLSRKSTGWQLLGASWDRAVGFERPKGHRFPPIYYVVPLVSSLLVSSATAILVAALDLVDLTDALILALVVGLGYAAAVSVNNALTPTTPRPVLLGAVTGSYHVVGILVVTTILVLWR